jgi:hypothetical protein
MVSLEDLHADLVAGDLRAASKIVERALPAMLSLIQRVVPKLQDGHEEACMDALLSYLEAPTAFTPGRARLLTYLANDARWRARTAVRTEARRQHYEQSYARDQAILKGESSAGEEVALDAIELQKLLEGPAASIFKDPDDGEIFLLMAAGERHSSAYLEVLDLDDTAENRAEVERRRERLRGRVRRLQSQLQPE